jgi:hypothetical protein
VESTLPVAFALEGQAPPGLEIRVNFGVFAGREATPAELDDLGRVLSTEVGQVAIVSERRHELGGGTGTSLHQVRVDVPAAAVPDDLAEAASLRARLLRLIERWAWGCIDARHADVIDLPSPGRPDGPAR